MIKRLKEDGVSILLATHEFHTVAHLCDTHLSLEAGHLRMQSLDQDGAERKIIPYG
jgi:ABC-type polysaccharide/polyol phosphate transport system ATPase subunit